MSKREKKIALITLFGNENFGNKLQNYAAQVYFENMGFEVTTIPGYWETSSNHSLRHYIHEFAWFLLAICGWQKALIRSANNRLNSVRGAYISKFNRYIRTAREISYRDIPKNLKQEYDYFVTGSDQVWHNWSGSKEELEYFLLTWVDRQQRITMSPSFGLEELPEKYIELYKRGLEGFDYLSCREESGSAMIRELTGKDCLTTLDPTMLIELKEWLKILQRPTQYEEKPYILVYALGKIEGDLGELLVGFSEKHKLKIINLQDIESDYYVHTGPDEFLYWINNAELVVTNSFHACVFSILFERKFVVYERQGRKGMLGRINTLLDKFELKERFYNENEHRKSLANFEKFCINDIDFSNVGPVLSEERQKAKDFYRKCFGISD